MKNNLGPLIPKVELWLVTGLAFLLPIFAWPITEQFLIDSKLLIMWIATLVTVFAYLTKVYLEKKLVFTISPLTLPILLITVAVLVSSFFAGSFPVEHILGFGGVFISSALIILLLPNLNSENQHPQHLSKQLVISLTLSAVALTAFSLLQMLGYGPSVLLSKFLPTSLPNNLSFNLAGSSLIATEIIVLALVGLGGLFFTEKNFDLGHKLLTLVVVVGLLIHGWNLLPNQPGFPSFLSPAASWSIVIDSLSSPRSAMIGFGPEGFVNAYNKFKPQWLNGTSSWNAQFTTASNFPFTFLVTSGVFGFLAWMFLVIKTTLLSKKVPVQTRPLQWMLLTSFAFQLFLPPSVVLLGIQAVIITAWISQQRGGFYEFKLHKFLSSNRFRLGAVGVVGILFMVLGLGLASAYLAKFKLFQSVKAAQNNNAVKAYSLQQSAVKFNPFLDSTRRRYGVTSLTIAAALSQKADRTQEETEQFAQLVQQAIREGRAATLLDPHDVNNWVALAQIYRSLIGTAGGSEQWAVTSYVKAIENAPTNPEYRVELGGVLYSQQQYEEAIEFFQQAINLKPDYANAYYNLANAHIQLGQFDQAKIAYQQTLLIVQPDSQDYLTASADLERLETLIKNSQAGEDLSVPEIDE